MQMIEAIIRPDRLDAVKTALARLGILGATAMESKALQENTGRTTRYRGASMCDGFAPRVLLKICVKDYEAHPAVYAIREAGRTGMSGDGEIFVSAITDAVRIRTGERNEHAL